MDVIFNPLEMAKKQNRVIVQSNCKLNNECSICLTEMENKPVLFLPCSHFFHLNCLYTAFDKCLYNCPLCRFDLKPQLPPLGIAIKEPVEDIAATAAANAAAIYSVMIENIAEMTDETIVGFLQHYIHLDTNTFPFYYTAGGGALPTNNTYPYLYYDYPGGFDALYGHNAVDENENVNDNDNIYHDDDVYGFEIGDETGFRAEMSAAMAEEMSELAAEAREAA